MMSDKAMMGTRDRWKVGNGGVETKKSARSHEGVVKVLKMGA